MFNYKFFYRLAKIISLFSFCLIKFSKIFLKKEFFDLLKLSYLHVSQNSLDSNYKKNGINFYCSNKTLLSRAIRLKSKEPDLIFWIDNFFKDNEIIYDIGANVGTYSLYAAKNFNLKVYAFEPEINNYSILSKNIILNNFQKKIIPISIGLTNQDDLSFKKLYLSSETPGKSNHQISIEENKNLLYQNILSTSLNHLIDINLIEQANHIKIDVDGLESKIIDGMTNLIENTSIKSIIIEWNCSIDIRKKYQKYFTEHGLIEVYPKVENQLNSYFLNKNLINIYSDKLI